jgi:hypothetical protein
VITVDGLAGTASPADPAEGEAEDHGIARLELRDARARLFDDARSLVPQDGRQRKRRGLRDDAEVAVAHPDGDQPNQEFVTSWLLEL